MAILTSTTAPTISASTISSPLTFVETGNGMIEFRGSTFLSNGGTADIITNSSGYSRMVGLGYFTGIMSATSWTFGHFTFQCSRYETTFANLLQSDWGGYSLANFQDPGNVNVNSARFTNSSGDSGTFHFTLLIQNHVGGTSPVTTRIK